MSEHESGAMPPPPPPPPPPDAPGAGASDGMPWAVSWWAKFRGLPGWAQGLIWLVLLPFVLLLFAFTKPAGKRAPWYVAVGVILVVGLIASVTSSEEEPVETSASDTTALERDTEASTTTEDKAPSTTERPTTTTSAPEVSVPERMIISWMP